jgi:hypothetical protein
MRDREELGVRSLELGDQESRIEEMRNRNE